MKTKISISLIILTFLVGGFFTYRCNDGEKDSNGEEETEFYKYPLTQLTKDQARDLDPSWCSNDKIVFWSTRTGNGDLYSINIDGTSLTRLTFSSEKEMDPSCSPNGSKVIYTLEKTGDINLWMLDLNTSETKQLTTDFGLWSAFSHDGEKIAYSGGNSDIYVMDIDGSNKVRLTSSSESEYAPCFSPDDSMIVYSKGEPGGGDPPEKGTANLWMMEATGSNQELLFSSDGEQVCFQEGWKGNKIVFMDANTPHPVIKLMNEDGTNKEEIASHSDFDNGDPAFSPDGSKIAFMTNKSGNSDIWIMELSTTGVACYIHRDSNGIWSSWENPGSNTTLNCPALITGSDGSIHYAVRGTDNNIYYINKDLSGNWTTWENVQRLYTSDSPALAATSDGIHLAARGTDNHVYYSYRNSTGKWSGWENPDSGATSSSPSLCSTIDGSIHLVIKGTDGSVYYNYRTPDGRWSSWEHVHRGYTLSSPAIINDSNGYIYLALRGADNGVYFCYRDLSGNWSSWEHVQGCYTCDSPAISSNFYGIHLAVRGTDNGVYYSSRDSSGNWSAWENPDSGATSSSPALCSTPDGYVHLVIRGIDSSVYYNRREFSGIWSSWENLGLGSTNDSPAITYTSDNNIHIALKGKDYNSVIKSRRTTSGNRSRK